jgi:hypothetical protein
MSSIVTVITPATNFKLTTLDTAKADLDITDSSQDAKLTRAIDQASGAIARYCDRVFAREAVREIIVAPSQYPLRLDRYPVVAITSINESGQAVAADGYEADLLNGRLYRLATSGDRTTWRGGRTIIEYTAGFLLPGETQPVAPAPQARTLPAEIEGAAIELITSFQFARGRDPQARSEDVPGLGSVEYRVDAMTAGDMPPGVASKLASYRRMSA